MAQDDSDSAMESSVEVQAGGSLKPKPSLAPKPILAPKPFSLQKSTAVRKIQAPKTANAGSKAKTHLSDKPNASSTTRPTLTIPVKAPESANKTSTASVTAKNPPATAEVNEALPHKDEVLDVSTEVTTPASKATTLEETPKPEPVEVEDVIQENHSASTDTDLEQKDAQKEDNGSQDPDAEKIDDKSNESPSETPPAFIRGSTPKRLSAKLKSMFEMGGPAPLPKGTVAFSTTKLKGETQKPELPKESPAEPAPEPVPEPEPAPSNREDSASEQKEDFTGGKSIKRRISLLFDSSTKQEVETKKQEPEIINSMQGVKDRIKNWAVETGSEGPHADEKLQDTPRIRSKSIEATASPAAADTAQTLTEVPDVEEEPAPPLDPPLPEEQSPVTQEEPPKDPLIDNKSLEISAEIMEEKKKVIEEEEIPPCINSQAVINDDDKESLRRNPEEIAKKKDKRRSVRFGTVVADDGRPPINLGSDPESSTEEETEEEEEDDEDVESPTASVPVLKSIKLLQEKSDEIQRQKEEKLKQKQKEEEEEQARLKLEEERKRKEEKEREKARQEKELKLKEEEAERQRMQEVERKRLKEEQERLEKERIEKERQEELLQQMQKEERRREEEENLEKEKTGSSLKEPGAEQPPEEENSKDENNQVEEEKMNEFEEVKMKEELEVALMKQRKEEEDRKRAREIEERFAQEEQEKERLREEAEERERQRLKEEEEEKLRQRREEEERERREQEKREEMEKLQLIERQEEERRRQIEKEREEQLKKKMQEELEKRQAEELKEKMKEEERQRKELELIKQEEESRPEPGKENLIGFEVEDLPPVSLCSPLSNIPEPTEKLIDVDYDDFSVKNPELDMEFDDFSVKPRKWGSHARAEAAPAKHKWAVDLEDILDPIEFAHRVPAPVEKEEELRPVQEQAGKTEAGVLVDLNQEEEEERRAGSEEEDHPANVEVYEEETPEEEEVEPKPEEEEEVEAGEDEAEEEDDKKVLFNSRKSEDQDINALSDQTHWQNGICEQTSEIRRSKPVSGHIPDVTPEAHEEPDLPLLPESSTSLLDTSAQKSKAQLGRTRNRARPTRSLRAKPNQNLKPELRVNDYSDATETEQRQSDSEEEKPKPKICLSPSSQRVAAIPGVKPADLIAHLKKRGTEKPDMKDEAEEKKPKEERIEEAAPPPLPRSPRLRTPPAGAALVLPPLGGDGSVKQSPAWLKELKSKKRMSQQESA